MSTPQQTQDPTFGGRIKDPVNQPTRLTIWPVILCYPHLFAPKKDKDPEQCRYQAEMWIAEQDPASYALNMGALYFAMNAAAVGEWKGRIPEFTNQPYKRLDTKKSDIPEDVTGYYLNARSKTAPGVSYNVAQPGQRAVLQPVTDHRMIYPGIVCAVALNAYAYDNKAQGVGWALNNVVILRDGVRRGGGALSAEEEFTDVLHALPFGQIGSHTTGAAAAAMPQQPGLAPPPMFQQPAPQFQQPPAAQWPPQQLVQQANWPPQFGQPTH